MTRLVLAGADCSTRVLLRRTLLSGRSCAHGNKSCVRRKVQHTRESRSRCVHRLYLLLPPQLSTDVVEGGSSGVRLVATVWPENSAAAPIIAARSPSSETPDHATISPVRQRWCVELLSFCQGEAASLLPSAEGAGVIGTRLAFSPPSLYRRCSRL